MSSVLVLNATYEPLSIVSVRRALVLLLKDKAQVVEATDEQIRSENMALPVPLVIRLVYFVRIPRRMNIPCTRRTVLLRDNYTCQYCGDHPSRAQLTLDHVVPRVQGGETTWDNVVCACKRCNLRKGGRTPEEAHMRLRKKPSRPRYMGMVVLSQAASHEAWRKYVPGGLAMEGEVA